jgi:hypothetical protein
MFVAAFVSRFRAGKLPTIDIIDADIEVDPKVSLAV